MPFIGSSTLRQLIGDNRRLDSEVRDLTKKADALAVRAELAELALTEAKAPRPVELDAVLSELRAFAPTLPYAPGSSVLSSGFDAKSFAQGLHLMLLHAQTVGRAEGAAR